MQAQLLAETGGYYDDQMLPDTGAEDTTGAAAAGLGLLGFAAGLGALSRRKKKQQEED